MNAEVTLPFSSRRNSMVRISGSFCLLALLCGTAFADDARQLRIEAGVLIQQAEAAVNSQERRTLLETAYRKLGEIQQRFSDQSTSLTLYLEGKRVSLSPSDVAMMIGAAPLLTDLNVGRLREVLGRHLSPTAVDENGWTDLHWAAVVNQPELVRVLTDLGANVGAALHDDGKLLSDQLRKSINKFRFSLFSKKGYHPSHIAAMADATAALTALLAAGAEVDAKTTYDGRTPLHVAALRNAGDVATTLIQHGANFNAKDKAGSTPLHIALGNYAGNVAAILIEHGADILAKDNAGFTPLHVAAFENAEEVAATLIERGAEINVKATKYGWTPLHAVALGNAEEVAAILIEHGADINAKDNEGLTPLHAAASRNAGEVAAILIEHGADILAKDNDGKSPLDVATTLGAEAVAATLRTQLGDR